MQYILMNYTRPDTHATGEDVRAASDDDVWGAYTRALVEAGILVGGEALHPSSDATTIRVTDSGRSLHDGPYADTREQLGGFYVIDVPDIDTALMWAARNPAASLGAVEVRPVVQRA